MTTEQLGQLERSSVETKHAMAAAMHETSGDELLLMPTREYAAQVHLVTGAVACGWPARDAWNLMLASAMCRN